LSRYKIAPASYVPNVKMGGDWIITQASRIDSDYDQYMVIGPDGYGTFTRNNADMGLLVALAKAYIEANGRPPNDPVLLLPYAQTPEQRAAIERVKSRMSQR
jgi:hypothetical protein